MKRMIFVLMVCAVVFCLIMDLSARRKGGPGPGPGPGGFFELMDTNKDGKISLEEWEAHHKQRFTDMDKNSDGFLDKDEIRDFRPNRPRNKKGR